MQDDPFATAPAADEAQAAPEPVFTPPPAEETAPAPAPAKKAPAKKAAAKVTPPPVADVSGETVRVTLKSGGRHDVPWITADFPSIDVAHERLTSAETQGKLVEIFDVTTRAAAKFQESAERDIKPPQASAPQRGGGGQQRKPAPAAAQQAPNGEKRFCAHGEMEFKSGISKKGNAYALFSCTAPRDEQCKAQYLN